MKYKSLLQAGVEENSKKINTFVPFAYNDPGYVHEFVRFDQLTLRMMFFGIITKLYFIKKLDRFFIIILMRPKECLKILFKTAKW